MNRMDRMMIVIRNDSRRLSRSDRAWTFLRSHPVNPVNPVKDPHELKLERDVSQRSSGWSCVFDRMDRMDRMMIVSRKSPRRLSRSDRSWTFPPHHSVHSLYTTLFRSDFTGEWYVSGHPLSPELLTG